MAFNPVFSLIQELGNINEKEMFRTFNMGIGMVVIVNKNSVQNIKKSIQKFSKSYEIGTVVSGNKTVKIL